MKRFLLYGLSAVALTLASCGNNQGQDQGYDGRSFDISSAQDGSLLAKSEKVGHNYALKIEGKGEAISYAKKELVPWNPIAKKIESVTIEEGIENIGDWYFASLPLDSYFLPSTVTSVGANSFRNGTTLYSYGSNVENAENIYYYSEQKPTDGGKHFYLDGDGNPHIWQASSILFVGNSFTFYVGDPDNDPGVPRYFAKIAENLGQEVRLDWVLKGSHTLTKFGNPEDEMGKILDEKLKKNHYDYVILQEQSTTPINNYSTFEKAVQTLKTKIDSLQKDCKTILYQTWASPTGIQGTKYQTTAEMELDLRDAYKRAGEAAECPVHYVGRAFEYVVENTKHNIYFDDNRHQNNYGAYLSAAVHVRNLFHYQVSRCSDFAGLESAVCQDLLGIADRF
ncbi:MAG: DUF4886 domain-containing protein [Candidatus Enteromonas sp.]